MEREEEEEPLITTFFLTNKSCFTSWYTFDIIFVCRFVATPKILV